MQFSAGAADAEIALNELRRLVQGLRLSAHAVERSLGISGAQLFVLRELAAEPGVSIRRVSERTLTDASSVSTVVSRLVERGLVNRTRQASDARASCLVVSRRGAGLLARAPEPYQARVIAALRALEPGRLREFRLALSEVVDALDLERGEAPLFFEAEANERTKKRDRRRRT
ncbi:MAG TPA: helix-turn-helix domain-containing protein [Polyangiaceae bacterium]|nr:helix-turn-helix domain-containing protein [Polyangiaceae bacterium]